MKKRRRLLALFSLILVISILALNIKEDKPQDAVAIQAKETSAQVAGDLKDGVYRATGQGFVDGIKVELVVENGSIASFRVIEHNETSQISKTALTTIPYEIEKKKTAKVDSISGATETSNGIIDGARACIRQAGGNPDDY